MAVSSPFPKVHSRPMLAECRPLGADTARWFPAFARC
jgi:hypothetical protein